MFRSVILIYIDEVANENALTEIGRRCMMRPEQKSFELRKVLVWKFFKTCDLVLKALAEMHSTARAYLLLQMQRKYVGCEKDSGCMGKLMDWLVKEIGWQLLNVKYNLKRAEELMEAAWL